MSAPESRRKKVTVFEMWERVRGKHRLKRRWYINDNLESVDLPLGALNPNEIPMKPRSSGAQRARRP